MTGPRRDLTPPERAKLVSVLGMLGSDHDGERANAAALASRMLRERGLTWADVVATEPPVDAAAEIARAAAEARAGHATQRGVGPDLQLCVRHKNALRAWEKEFVASVAVRTKRSPKQNQIIREIAAALRARGLA